MTAATLPQGRVVRIAPCLGVDSGYRGSGLELTYLSLGLIEAARAGIIIAPFVADR
jgi:hypothetical protein